MKRNFKLLFLSLVALLPLASCNPFKPVNPQEEIVQPIVPSGTEVKPASKHHVVFLDLFGNVLSDSFVEDGGSVKEPFDKGKDLSDTENFYKFQGFDSKAEKVTKDLTIHATYETIPYDGHYAFSLNEDGGYTLEKYQLQDGDPKEDVVTIPPQYNGHPVTKIGEDAFVNNKDITKIVLPQTITEIMGQAFGACANLTEINLPEGLTDIDDEAFKYCINLPSITFPSTLKYIGNHAFDHCQKLNSILLPDSLEDLGEYAFTSCFKASKLTIGSKLRLVGAAAFYGTPVLSSITVSPTNHYFSFDGVGLYYNIDEPDESGKEHAYKANTLYFVLPLASSNDYNIKNGVEAISDYAFATIKGIKKVIAPKTITQVGQFPFSESEIEEVDFPLDGSISFKNGIFSKMSKLKKFTLPNSLTDIPDFSFEDTTSLKEASLPDTITHIGQQAFLNSGIVSFTFPRDLESLTTSVYSEEIGEDVDQCWVFQGTKNLKTVDMSKATNLTEIPLYCFYQSGLTSISIPSNIKKIGDFAFAETSIETLTIPETITSLGTSAFSQSAVKEVTILGPRSLSFRSFWKCKNLTKVTLGEKVRFIDKQVFYGCSNLNEIHIPSVLRSIGELSLLDDDDKGSPLPLKDIYYNGTQEDFAKIKIDASNKFDPSKHTIHFQSTSSSN